MSRGKVYRFFITAYSVVLFVTLIFYKQNNLDKINDMLNRNFKPNWDISTNLIYILGFIAIAIIVFYLPLLTDRFLKDKSGILNPQYVNSLFIFAVVGGISIIGWATTQADTGYPLYIGLFSLGVGIIELFYYPPLFPDFLGNENLSIDRKTELIKLEQDRWWMTTQIFGVTVIALTIGAIASFYFASTPVKLSGDELLFLKLKTELCVIFVLLSLVGTLFIFLNCIIRTNKLRNKLEELYYQEKSNP